MNYHNHYLEKLKKIESPRGKDIAVLGCSFGNECELLVREGANSVAGYDQSSQIGRAFQHENVTYYKQSICDLSAEENTYDIVYSIAVFEHVHNIEAAFKEAARICKPGGLVLIISSPIWYAPYGSHMNGELPRMPWCHLLFSPSRFELELQEVYPEISKQKQRVDDLIERIYDPVYFNKYPSTTYLQAAADVKNLDVTYNSTWPAALDIPNKDKYFSACVECGFPESELKLGAHYFEARKRK